MTNKNKMLGIVARWFGQERTYIYGIGYTECTCGFWTKAWIKKHQPSCALKARLENGAFREYLTPQKWELIRPANVGTVPNRSR